MSNEEKVENKIFDAIKKLDEAEVRYAEARLNRTAIENGVNKAIAEYVGSIEAVIKKLPTFARKEFKNKIHLIFLSFAE